MPLFVRPALPQDEQFVYELAWQVMHDQLHAWRWDPNIRHALLDLQVRSKRNAYAAAHPHADYAIIMLDDQPVGHMIIDRSGEFYDLVDISILPKHRGAGIGTRLILALSMEAEMVHKNVRLYVSISNPRAADLYRRLGFRVIQDLETDLLMERTPGDRAKVIAAP
ncbi:MAG: GNAT family N-acetyltransferase [Acidobacteriia bacterium]|nr:GNAT family N-acetyltransferase [Terriglobia bacterium]